MKTLERGDFTKIFPEIELRTTNNRALFLVIIAYMKDFTKNRVFLIMKMHRKS